MADTIYPGSATPSQVLTGYSFSAGTNYNAGGTMPNASTNITPGTSAKTIPAGWHDGAHTVAGDANLVAGNIKSGVSVFGVAGSLQPRQFASGTFTSGTATGNFKNQNNTVYGEVLGTVSGLTFQPSVIVIQTDATLSNYDITVYNANFNFASSCPIEMQALGSSGSDLTFQLDGTVAYVNSTGFCMPLHQSGVTYHWVAFA